MNARDILDGLLDPSQRATNVGLQMADGREIVPPAGNDLAAMLKGAGAGATAAGAVALLFGSKGTRKFAKKAAKFGGTAAVGGLAYTAYSAWQAQQQMQNSQASAGPRSADASPPPTLDLEQFAIGEPIDKLDAEHAARRSEALIQAMVSAARADGHVDEDEMESIGRQMESLGLEDDVTRFLLSAMSAPVDVERIAALADTPETAAELYVVSAMVADMDGTEERAYLDDLARALTLDSTLVRELEAPIRG